MNKDSYLVLEKLPVEYDSRVKAMEVDERPTEQYGDIGGLDKQIQELIEAVVLPMTHKDRFEALGIQPPKGVLLYGPPGTGKTLLARACAAQTKSAFLKLAGPQLVQMFIGERIAGDKFGSVTTFDSRRRSETRPRCLRVGQRESPGDYLHRRTGRHWNETIRQREGRRSRGAAHDARAAQSTRRISPESRHQVGRTHVAQRMFIEYSRVIAATNRVDILDPALLRSGRLDRKIEFPHPNETVSEALEAQTIISAFSRLVLVSCKSTAAR